MSAVPEAVTATVAWARFGARAIAGALAAGRSARGPSTPASVNSCVQTNTIRALCNTMYDISDVRREDAEQSLADCDPDGDVLPAGHAQTGDVNDSVGTPSCMKVI